MNASAFHRRLCQVRSGGFPLAVIVSVVSLALCAQAADAAPGDVDPNFTPNPGIRGARSVAVQADGKVIVGGNFDFYEANFTIRRTYFARLYSDGTTDLAFDTVVDRPVLATAVQEDGKLLIAGEFGRVDGVVRYGFARLQPDGNLDAAFDSKVSGVSSLALQPDGKILVGGPEIWVDGVAHNQLARLHPDGALDAGFNPVFNAAVLGLALQSDGKILVGGNFSTVGGATRNRLARLLGNGTLDTAFNPNVGEGDGSSAVNCLTVQPNGRILVAGRFSTVGGISRNSFARLQSNGTLDAGFDPRVAGVSTVALQTDGRILIGGKFDRVGDVGRSNLARLQADGTLDAGFNLNIISVFGEPVVYGMAMSRAGALLVGGDFTTVGAVARSGIVALENDVSTQSLTVIAQNRVEWLRGGASAETQHVVFDLSTDGGSSYAPLGSGARMTGGWQLSGLNLPVSGQIRARARTTGGLFNHSAGFVDALVALGAPTPEIVVEQPAGTNLSDGASSGFGGVDVGGTVSLTFTLRNTGTGNLQIPDVTIDGTDAAQFSVTSLPDSPVASPHDRTAFTVRFSPTSAGAKSATLHLSNNDTDEGSFEIVLTGEGTLSPNAELSQLVLSGAPLSFLPWNTSYTASVPYLTAALTVTATPAHPGATLRVNGSQVPAGLASGPINLAVGDTIITVLVTAQDGLATTTYTITVTRGAISADANLADLVLVNGSLTPPFAAGTTSYTASVPYPITSVRVRPTRAATVATVKVNGNQVLGESLPISLAVGNNPITVLVTAQDGTTKTYVVTVIRAASLVPGDVDPGFAASLTGTVHCTATQEDGKIIVGGAFSGPRNRLARLDADGAVDPNFNANIGGNNSVINSVAVQADGKIIVGGSFAAVAGMPRFNLARLNANGSLDTTFNPGVTGRSSPAVHCMAIQSDESLLIGGNFSTVQGLTREGLARVRPDGTVDPGFDLHLQDSFATVYTASVLDDGKILLGGLFSGVAGLANKNLVRVTPGGTVDAGFNPDVPALVYATAVQPDGKVLVGGAFPSSIGGLFGSGVVRLHADGSIDPDFDPGLEHTNGPMVHSLVAQSDGRVLLGGEFTWVAGTSRTGVARLDPDGSLDLGFQPLSPVVAGLSAQADGRILLGGAFSSVGGLTRSRIARLENGPTTQNLTVTGGNRVVWMRGGTTPETHQVRFDLSTDEGITHTPLGLGTRVPGGWELTGLALPASGRIRALARTAGGRYNGSSGLVGMVASIGPPSPSLTLQQPADTALAHGGSRDFGSVNPGASSSLTFTLKNIGTADLELDGLTIEGAAASQFRISAGAASPVSALHGSTTFTLTFAPTSTGAKAATLRLDSNDPVRNPIEINLTGTGVLSANADLATLSLGSGTLTPAFASATTNYTASVPYQNASLSLFATTSHAGSGVMINGTPVRLDYLGNPVDLAVGANTITMLVTAQNGTAKSYTLEVSRAAASAPGDLELDFVPVLSGSVVTLVMQPDGRIVLGGSFLGDPEPFGSDGSLRLEVDGAPESRFRPKVTGSVYCTAVQADGRLLLGGTVTAVGGVTRNGLARLDAQGALDPAFNPDVNGAVACAAVQADGKILIGGWIEAVGGVNRKLIARLHPNGSLDADFDARIDPVNSPVVYCLATQPDGKVLVGGRFYAVGGVSRSSLVRLHPDGSLDQAFNPDVKSDSSPQRTVSTIVMQPDGKILIGGGLNKVGGATRNHLARLNPDGSLDPNFNPDVGGSSPDVVSLALQADGGIILVGDFTSVGGQIRNRVARVHADGSLDVTFNPNVAIINYSELSSAALQAGGRVLLGGNFTVGGLGPYRVAGLENGPASQLLTALSASRVEWLRGGTSPEAQEVTFDLSTDHGLTHTRLGVGTRIQGGWELAGLSLPPNGQLRARARISCGERNGSSGLVESMVAFGRAPAPEVSILRASTALTDGGGVVFGEANLGGVLSIVLDIRNTGEAALSGLGVSIDGPDAGMFTVASAPTAPIVAGGSTILTVRFAPTTTGLKTASLHLANNDPDENPFDLTLTGTSVLSSDADLSGLVLSTGPLTPAFAAETTSYAARVPFNNTTCTLTLTAAQPGASITLNGASVASGVLTGPLSLAVGENLLSVLVRAQDGVTTGSYTLTVTRAAAAVAGDLDLTFHPEVDGPVYSATPQPDGKLVIGGLFTAVDGLARSRLARLNSDGSLDPGFAPTIDGAVKCIAVQADGSLLVGGTFLSVDGVPRPVLARLQPNGVLDPGFAPMPAGDGQPFSELVVDCLSIQANRRILLGGTFKSLRGVSRTFLARLHADGTVDQSFDPKVGRGSPDRVTCLSVQENGGILFGGDFDLVNGTAVRKIARLDEDGLLDQSFTPNSLTSVYSLAMQPGGGILATGGEFLFEGGRRTGGIARLLNTGSVDAAYHLNAGYSSSSMYSLALQTNGTAVIGGAFTLSGGSPGIYWTNLARIRGDGTVDSAFVPNAGSWVSGASLQADGKILLAGRFPGVGGFSRQHLARLENDPATQSLTVPSAARVRWLRGGSSPETQQVSFELSTDGGGSYSALGSGTRISGGWELDGLNLPASGRIRARARVAGAHYNGSSGLVETVAEFAASLTLRESWRLTHFDTTGNTGSAADSADFDEDGMTNFLEFACHLDPTATSTQPIEGVRAGGTFELTYTRSKAALGDGVLFFVEWSDGLAATSWSTAGVSEFVHTENETAQLVRASMPAGENGQRFARLRMVAP